MERVVIVPYDPAWPDRFRALAIPLRDALGSTALRIDHIGSTSVPGLAAKPIVDIQISVAAFEPFDAIRMPLEGLGYVYRADNDDLIWSTMVAASDWSQRGGWEPGPPDA
jgi:GrpB-like predicted nucleotidyltransferase (UPF0157 family)